MIEIDRRKILVFDIEVAAHDFETFFDEETKTYLLQYAKDDDMRVRIIEELVFNSFTSKLVAVSMWDVNDEKGCVLINCDKDPALLPERDSMTYVQGTEKEIVEQFWKIIAAKNYNLFVTFNGREFDCPYMMLKSFEMGVRPTFNFMQGSDFTFRDYHIDLLKEFTFNRHSPHGARRKFSLDFYCKRLGVRSPKDGGVKGDKVTELYNSGEYKKIADYAAEDAIAEAELFKIWNKFLNI
ncbi:MAG: ribonuclease H-like domain-containing protein [Ignavibacteriae bacterium]|nr:ribonuclease H-like domain-containing protein [Ignavibacteriota bacterium]MCB9242316.1 ribonuclease H-like domain-containing protein [Ignavibacteriales bacterium]